MQNVGPVLHADSADISSTDIFNRGGKPRFGTTGSGGSALRQYGIFFLALLVTGLAAAVEIPSASKILGAARGKSFRKGLVFVNGKYLPPPYTVERWGCGIRINRIPVVGEVVPWESFVKTQQTAAPAPKPPAPAPTPIVSAPKPVVADSLSLDDLFDDDPPPAPVAKASPVVTSSPKDALPRKEVEFEGPFVANEASRLLVKRVNDVRTKINTILLADGFVFFGDGYSRVSGDSRTAMRLLERLPDLMRTAESPEGFVASVRAAGLVYLTEAICRDLYANRVDYRKLKERWSRLKQAADEEQLLKDVVNPLL